MSCVHVVKVVVLPGSRVAMETDWTMSHATADQFTPGLLEISSTETGEILQTFLEPDWLRVSVMGEDGYEEFSFENLHPSAERKSA